MLRIKIKPVLMIASTKIEALTLLNVDIEDNMSEDSVSGIVKWFNNCSSSGSIRQSPDFLTG